MGRRLRQYVAAVTAAGVLGVVAVHLGAGWRLDDPGVVFVALSAMVVLGDLAPMWAPGLQRDGLVPLSPIFALARLLRVGASPAAVASSSNDAVAISIAVKSRTIV